MNTRPTLRRDVSDRSVAPSAVLRAHLGLVLLGGTDLCSAYNPARVQHSRRNRNNLHNRPNVVSLSVHLFVVARPFNTSDGSKSRACRTKRILPDGWRSCSAETRHQPDDRLILRPAERWRRRRTRRRYSWQLRRRDRDSCGALVESMVSSSGAEEEDVAAPGAPSTKDELFTTNTGTDQMDRDDAW